MRKKIHKINFFGQFSSRTSSTNFSNKMMLSIDNFSILNNVKRVLFWLLSHWLCGSSCAWPHDIHLKLTQKELACQCLK